MTEAAAPVNAVPGALLAQFAGFLATHVGLDFPAERRHELAGRMQGVARELGQADAAACIRELMAAALTRPQIEVLASHLTNGETYFFRERDTFRTLDEQILPNLIRLRRGERRLRIWSAGCSTGEEPYSIAILLDRWQAELAHWDISILATDINLASLRKGAEARYGRWSFRGVPRQIVERYFRKLPDDRFELLPRLRERVRFSYDNLAQDGLPPIGAIDIIVCRNVLMYVTADAANLVLRRFHRALAEGGSVIPGAAEALQMRRPGWRAVRIESCIVLQKTGAHHPAAPRAAPREARRVEALAARHQLASAPVTSTARACTAPDSAAVLARRHADAGRLEAALAWSREALASNKLDPAAHYVHALIETEAGHPAQAAQSLRRALYLDPDFMLAHLALANLALRRGERAALRRHIDAVLALLARCAPRDPVPGAEGMAAGSLARIVGSLRELAYANA